MVELSAVFGLRREPALRLIGRRERPARLETAAPRTIHDEERRLR